MAWQNWYLCVFADGARRWVYMQEETLRKLEEKKRSLPLVKVPLPHGTPNDVLNEYLKKEAENV